MRLAAPLLTTMPVPFETRTISLAAAHQDLFTSARAEMLKFPVVELSPPLSFNASGPSPPKAPAYMISKAAPFRLAVRTRVCLTLVIDEVAVDDPEVGSGREIIWAVRGLG